ncbi:MAG: phage shock protein A [Desulfobacterales bacterium]|nr:phage shock protein A [Desulfobacterales bacterium]MCP4160102.1 phage shock protein A [Deltaproteobacteria bacterium]
MGIFSRFKDIVGANLNAMLDKAEDPEKMIKLMIREMEDTLIELKASCAGVIAERKKTERYLSELTAKEDYWQDKAVLAVSKGKDDLAKEALVEKQSYTFKKDSVSKELEENVVLEENYREDIRQLEEKLQKVRDKQRVLVQRHIRAEKSKRMQSDLRKFNSSEAIVKFEKYENRIERMEAEAELVNYGVQPDLEDKFAKLERDENIEKELQKLKDQSKSE